MLSPRATTIIVALVAAIWAANFIAGLALSDYEADQAINGIFMAIVGGAIALGRSKPVDRKDEKDEDGSPHG